MNRISILLFLLIPAVLANAQTRGRTITMRLNRVATEDVESYLATDASFDKMIVQQLVAPSNTEIINLDLKLGKILRELPTTYSDRPHYKEALELITMFRHSYGGQFFAYEQQNGDRILVCTYSWISKTDDFQKNSEVVWLGDPKAKHPEAGGVFQFQYNATSEKVFGFRINDGKKEKFGEKEIPFRSVIYPRRPFKISAGQNFTIRLARGGGMVGVDLIEVAGNGDVAFYKRNGDHTNFKLSKPELTAIVASVNAQKLTRLESKYINKDIHDGSQWILWISRDDKQSVTYFSNEFPDAIRNFAKTLDSQLNVQGRSLDFIRKKPNEDHAKAIWAATHN